MSDDFDKKPTVPRVCINNPDVFCYVCGNATTKNLRRNITPRIRAGYEDYFNCTSWGKDKKWAPNVCCSRCANALLHCKKTGRKILPFSVPMVWREPTDHETDCYFCLTNIAGVNKKKRRLIAYANVSSAIRPTKIGDDPENIPPKKRARKIAIKADNASTENSTGPSADGDVPNSTVHLITPAELEELTSDLRLTKEKAEILATKLQNWNLLESACIVSDLHSKVLELQNHFKIDGELCYCPDATLLLRQLGFDHKPREWRLFIDSAKRSLKIKVMLLHISNKFPSIPVAYATKMKESHEVLELILKKINYNRYNWNVCADLKVVGLLMGLQGGYTKYCCFLCMWDSRARSQHYKIKSWVLRDNYIVGENNVMHKSLVHINKIHLPPLYIKLGIMKNFVKAMNKNWSGFHYLKRKFPALSEFKVKEGNFMEPHLRELMTDNIFVNTLTDAERNVWTAFKKVSEHFLGTHRSADYAQIVADLLKRYEELGCVMSLKLHFLHSHLDFFSENLCAVSDEHAERFHQDMHALEERHARKNATAMLADYCWNIVNDTASGIKRQARKNT